MKIALIAHDRKKAELVNFMIAYEAIFNQHELYSTGTTGTKIMEQTDLIIHRFQSGPLGGDQQVGALIAEDELDLLIFFRDPLQAQPHEPDIIALLRLCDVYSIPVGTNVATAEILTRALEDGKFAWREVVHRYKETPEKESSLSK